MNNRHEFLGNLGIAAFGNCVMVVAQLAQSAVAAPIVGDKQRPWRDGALDEAAQRIGTPIGGDGQPDSTGIAAIFPFVLGSAQFPVADFHCGGDQRFVMDAPAFAARPSADPCLIHLDMSLRQTTDPVAVGPNHARAEFVQEAKAVS